MTLIAKLSPAVLLLGLAGCATTGSYYVPPLTEAPDAYVAEPVGVGNAAVETAWWKLFGDPALDGLIAEALAANLDARLAVARLDEARALAGVSRAGRLPGGGVDAGYQRRRLADGERSGGQPREGDALRLGAEASWEIDLFGRVRRGVEAAEAEVGGAEALLRSARAAVTADVASQYFKLRGSEAALAVARRQIETQRRSLDVTRKLERAGAGARFDIVRAEAALAAVEATLPGIEQRISTARHGLAVLLGKTPQSFTGPAATTASLPRIAQIGVGAPADLLRRRPDIAAAERALAAATARRGVAEAELFPTVRLSGFIGLLAGGFESLFTGGALAFAGGPSLDWGVFDMPRLRAQVRVADARTDVALIDYHRTVLNALRDVEDALVAYGTIRTSLAMRDQQVGASREAARMASVRFREGEGQYLDVLDAERSLYEAEATLVAARADHLLSVVEIHRALGGGWEACEATDGPVCSGDGLREKTPGA
jgi:multidrug efflux system outer membrane protein